MISSVPSVTPWFNPAVILLSFSAFDSPAVPEPHASCHGGEAYGQEEPVHHIDHPERLVHVGLFRVGEDPAEDLPLQQQYRGIQGPGKDHDHEAGRLRLRQDRKAVFREEEPEARDAHDPDEPFYDTREPVLDALEQEGFFEGPLGPVHHREDNGGHEGDAADPDNDADDMDDEQDGEKHRFPRGWNIWTFRHYFTKEG